MASSENRMERLIQDYLDHVRRALLSLPTSRREEIIQEIAQHIAEARQALAPEDEAGLCVLLDRIGTPAQIADEAGIPAPKPSRTDPWVPWLLLLGGFLFGIGWIVGAILLWSSRAWSTGQKLLGTLVWPGGLAAAFVLFGMPAQACSSSPATGVHCTGTALPIAIGIPILIISLAAPVVTAFYLDRVRQRGA